MYYTNLLENIKNVNISVTEEQVLVNPVVCLKLFCGTVLCNVWIWSCWCSNWRQGFTATLFTRTKNAWAGEEALKGFETLPYS